jgi:hypothetical protein
MGMAALCGSSNVWLRCPPFRAPGRARTEGILPKILHALASGVPLRNMEEKQAICKQFADLLWFVMEFDELKVCDAPYLCERGREMSGGGSWMKCMEMHTHTVGLRVDGHGLWRCRRVGHGPHVGAVLCRCVTRAFRTTFRTTGVPSAGSSCRTRCVRWPRVCVCLCVYVCVRVCEHAADCVAGLAARPVGEPRRAGRAGQQNVIFSRSTHTHAQRRRGRHHQLCRSGPWARVPR